MGHVFFLDSLYVPDGGDRVSVFVLEPISNVFYVIYTVRHFYREFDIESGISYKMSPIEFTVRLEQFEIEVELP